MIKKLLSILLILTFSILTGCGTVIKYGQLNKPVTNKLDYMVVALDSMGLILFIVPGVVAFSVDYMTGTLFLPAGSVALGNTSSENIQKVLAQNNINVSIAQLNQANSLKLNYIIQK